MSTLSNGGPAFPSKRRIQRAGYPTNDFEPVGGMSLRDYFAAKAMQGLVAGGSTDRHQIAQAAYLVSDAMLHVRGLKP